MFNSCLTRFSSDSVPRTEAIALCSENENADANIPKPKTNVFSFISITLRSIFDLSMETRFHQKSCAKPLRHRELCKEIVKACSELLDCQEHPRRLELW